MSPIPASPGAQKDLCLLHDEDVVSIHQLKGLTRRFVQARKVETIFGESLSFVVFCRKGVKLLFCFSQKGRAII